MSMLELLIILSIALIFAGAPSGERRRPGPSWFDIMPNFTESKSRRGRGQQTHRQGSRRYGR